MATTTSSQFSLNIHDVIKGLIMAGLTPVFAIIIQSVNEGSLTFNWKTIVLAALAGALGYITKNFFTPSAIVVSAPKETVQAVKDGTADVEVTKK